MKRKILVCMIIALIIIISIFGIKYLIKSIEWKKFENRVTEFYNGGRIPIDEQFSEYSFRWLEYAKTEVPQEYDISDAIKEYYNKIELAIKKILNDKLDIRYDSYYKDGGLDEVRIHGITDSKVEYICKNISHKDIQDYMDGLYFDKLKTKLEEIFIHKSNDAYSNWYIKNDKDKRIELPYNVYCDYKHNGKKLKNQVKKINTIKISKNLPCFCDVEYTNNENKVIKTKIHMVTASRSNNKILYALPSLRELFYTNDTQPELNFGQHDYDEAMRKEDEEFAKLGVSENTLTNAWSTNDNEQYDTSSVLTVEDIYKIAIDGYSKSTASDAKANKEKLEKDLENYLNGKK